MGDYITSIIVAAILCAIIKGLIGEKSATGKISGLLCSVLMAITLIAPFKDVKFYNIPSYFNSLTDSADKYVLEGTSAAEKSIADIIKVQTEAYILDKADRMGLDISVEVELDERNSNVPDRVTVKGKLSPYAKEVFSNFLQDELGIAKEKQQWT